MASKKSPRLKIWLAKKTQRMKLIKFKMRKKLKKRTINTLIMKITIKILNKNQNII